MSNFFINDKTIDDLDALPTHLPDNKKLHEVHNSISIKQTMLNLNISRDGHKNMGTREALRELSQNLLDETVKANQFSFNNLHMSELKRTRKNRSEFTTIFFNNNKKLSEIIHVENPSDNPRQYFADKHERNMDKNGLEKLPFGTLSFINYGVVIYSPNNILCIGKSSKGNQNNQIGKHGEGLKIAIVILLKYGCGVDIYTPVVYNGISQSQRWRFYISNDDDTRGNLSYKRTSLAPHPIVKNEDKHHFELRITYNKEIYPKGLDYNIFNYLLTPTNLIRNPLDENDKGDLLLDIPGKIYVRNFFVCSYTKDKLHWGYNFFIPIGRDRNYIDYESITSSMASIWNNIIMNNTDKALLLLNEIVLRNNNTYESEMLPLLSNCSKTRLTEIFDKHYPNCYPIFNQDKPTCLTNIPIRVPKHAIDVLKYYDLDVYILSLTQQLNSSPKIENEQTKQISRLFDNIVLIHFHSNENIPLIHGIVPYKSITLNWCLILEQCGENIDEIINYICFYILPRGMFETIGIIKRLKKVIIRKEEKKRPRDEPQEESSSNHEEQEEEESKEEELLPKAPKGYYWIKKKVHVLIEN